MVSLTYSIVALDLETKALGVAVASGSVAVGSRIPWVRRGVGAIATQAYTNVMYGKRGLLLLERGYTPERALLIMLREDPRPDLRQVAILDINGRRVVHTGKGCPEWKGHYIGEYYVVVGNLLVGPKVLDAVVGVLERKKYDFPELLLRALVAGEDYGGDARGNRWAAIWVEGSVSVRLRIDDSKEPAKKLLGAYLHRFGRD